jgi:transcription antitermination factor NusG
VTDPIPNPDSLISVAAPWFALWTRSRAEKSVLDQLLRKDVEAYLPTVSRWSRWKDRRKQVDWPLFPGYCFARFEPRNTLPILKCVGVVQIVSFNGVPAPIPEQEIDSVRILLASQLPHDPCPMMTEGDLVEVVHGPLKGSIGRLLRKGPRTRVQISIDIINRAVAVEVDAADIRKK